MEWPDMLRFTMDPLELVARGTLMFWFLFLIFRFILRRDVGSVGVSDFLFVVILGDAAQNAMIGDGTSASDGMLLIATLVVWNWSVDRLTYSFPALEKMLAGKRLCLVRDGKMQRREMRREYITTEELMAKLREQGSDDLSEVKAMFLEADGEISVLKKEKKDGG